MNKVTVSAKVGRYLKGLAHRLEKNPDFMAYVLSVYQAQESLDDTALAEHLGMTVDMLPRLALCKRPSAESIQFAGHVRQIAAYVGTDPALVANIIHQVDSLETWVRQSTASGNDRQTTHSLHTQAGLLAAARDRNEKESDQDSSHEPKSPPEE